MRQGRWAGVAGKVAAASVTAVLVVGLGGAPAGARSSGTVAKAKKALLVLGDMPKGWKSSKSSNGNSGAFPGAKQLAQCLGVPASVINANPPAAYSPDFNSKNQELTVNDDVSIYPTARAAAASHSALANAKTPACLTTALNGPAKKALEQGFGSGTTIGTIEVTRTPASDYASHGANFTAFIPVTSQGVTLNVALTVVDYIKGSEDQTVSFTAIETPFPISLARHLTQVAAGRL